jgi:hypothetical protein
MKKMNPEVKAKWLAALRSEEYVQGDGKLKRRDVNGNVFHCCLGVLCEIYEKDENKHERSSGWSLRNNEYYEYSGCPNVPPLVVTAWAGLEESNPIYNPDSDDINEHSLAQDNDNGYSFEAIAAIIEKEF